MNAQRMTLATAIARQEGFYVTGTRAMRNNNPGNLEYGPFAMKHGATGTDGRFAIFRTSRAGFNALESLLRSPEYAPLTVAQGISKFAPASENNTANYIRNVCAWRECLPTDIVRDVLNAEDQWEAA